MEKSKRKVLYLLSFLLALHITPATYINSSMIEQFVGSKYTGYVFAISAILALVYLGKVKTFLNKVGNYKVFVWAVISDFIGLAIMSLSMFFSGPLFGTIFVTAYVLSHVARIAMIFSLDIFLESYTKNSDTGGIRGNFLTALNMSYIIGPLLASALVTSTIDAGRVYVWGLIILLPIFFIAKKHFSDYVDAIYKKNKIIDTIEKIFGNKDLFNICGSNLTLSFFYSWMIIYTPIFLSEIGFTLSEVTLIIGIALIPFVFLQIPLGRLADKKMGEKEILIAGFLIAGIATIVMSFVEKINFVDAKSVVIWMVILFITRIGASMIEIMNETYLFKKVSESDANVLSIYRSIESLSYVVGPIIASILLIFFNINFLFIILGIITLHGINFAWRIRDTL